MRPDKVDNRGKVRRHRFVSLGSTKWPLVWKAMLPTRFFYTNAASLPAPPATTSASVDSEPQMQRRWEEQSIT
jgi:hypothetical protein